jgi:hypothetical protein
MSNQVKLPEYICKCGYKLDASTFPKNKEKVVPVVGDFSVCFKCGRILRFGEGLQLRPVTPEELVELYTEKEELYREVLKLSALFSLNSKDAPKYKF